MPLIDSYNRTIDYLRVSVTDRCNFRCVYCMPEEGASVSPRHEILTFEEIARLVRIAVGLGMTRIRLTGGEPLIRRDIDSLIQQIGQIDGISDLSITTNGYLLSRYAQSLASAGLTRVNVSLDTLRPERFVSLARRGDLATVLDGISAARDAGLSPIKLNCVIMRGWNDDEAVDFARMTLEQPFEVRFIELMPINWSRGDDSITSHPGAGFDMPIPDGSRRNSDITLYANTGLDSFAKIKFNRVEQPTGMLNAAQMRRAFVSTAEIQRRIETVFGPLLPASTVNNGPARSFRIAGACGTIGFISQITNDLCLQCNRLRLTADGQLRPCLMADGEVDLRGALRSDASDEQIEDLFRVVVRHKPKEHRLEDGMAPTGRNMSQLGG